MSITTVDSAYNIHTGIRSIGYRSGPNGHFNTKVPPDKRAVRYCGQLRLIPELATISGIHCTTRTTTIALITCWPALVRQVKHMNEMCKTKQ